MSGQLLQRLSVQRSWCQQEHTQSIQGCLHAVLLLLVKAYEHPDRQTDFQGNHERQRP